MNKDIAVKLHNISKVYKLYDKPIDRLKESLHPLKKQYHRNFHALKNINLEIKKGEVLGIVGVNGAGKSTLLKIIAGVLTPTTGRVSMHGRINAILELGSSMKPEMTGKENIKLNLQINGIEKDYERITQDIIDFADIGEHINQPVKTYSSGMKARLGFGIATSTDPDILIVDEVLAVGDVLFQRKCYGKIEKLFKDGKTVIFVSHNAQSVIEFCSRAVLLYEREIIMDESPKKVIDFYQKLVFSTDKIKVPNMTNKKINTKTIVSNNKQFNFSNYLYSETHYLKENISEPKILKNANIKCTEAFLLDSFNEIVNVLETSNYYKLCCYFTSTEFIDILSFGVAIQTVKGMSLSCTNENILKEINKDGYLYIEWEFKCVFLYGKYFIKINLTDKNKNILLRITDLLMIEVNQEETKKRNQEKICFIDLEQNIIKVENDSNK